MGFDPEKITFFAKTDARGQQVPFGIKAKDRQRHMYVVGKTGMGKSTLLENMAVQDIKNGEGMAFIDPHGSAAETLLEYIPEHRVNDVIYFAPFDLNNPISFNVMEDVGPDKRHLVVSGLMSTFKKIWVDAWSARMEYILTNALLALIEYPDTTLLSVNRLFTDKAYRLRVVDYIKDPAVKAFWTEEFANYTDRFAAEALPAIQNKIGQFTGNPLIRNIIGQPHSSFDLRKVMDEKKILIMNLSKGLIGETNANLLGSMLTTRIYLAAMSRADLSVDQMKQMPNFYFYVDEFQSFANATFANILSEARKYHLNLIIAHQYIEQMEEEVKNAVFGNVGTTVSFRVGPFDAEVLETVFSPQFLAADLVNLGFAQIYLTLMIDGIGSQPFSAITLPPIERPRVSYKAVAITTSRRNFTKTRDEVEKLVAELNTPEKVDNSKKTNNQGQGQNQNQSQNFNAKNKKEDYKGANPSFEKKPYVSNADKNSKPTFSEKGATGNQIEKNVTPKEVVEEKAYSKNLEGDKFKTVAESAPENRGSFEKKNQKTDEVKKEKTLLDLKAVLMKITAEEKEKNDKSQEVIKADFSNKKKVFNNEFREPKEIKNEEKNPASFASSDNKNLKKPQNSKVELRSLLENLTKLEEKKEPEEKFVTKPKPEFRAESKAELKSSLPWEAGAELKPESKTETKTEFKPRFSSAEKIERKIIANVEPPIIPPVNFKQEIKEEEKETMEVNEVENLTELEKVQTLESERKEEKIERIEEKAEEFKGGDEVKEAAEILVEKLEEFREVEEEKTAENLLTEKIKMINFSPKFSADNRQLEIEKERKEFEALSEEIDSFFFELEKWGSEEEKKSRQENNYKNTSQVEADLSVENSLQNNAEIFLEKTPEETAENIPQDIPQNILQDTPQNIPQDISQNENNFLEEDTLPNDTINPAEKIPETNQVFTNPTKKGQTFPSVERNAYQNFSNKEIKNRLKQPKRERSPFAP